MLSLDELLVELGYNESPHYYQSERAFEPETVHLFRAAREAGVSGAYVFETSPNSEHHILPARPAIFVADVQLEKREEAEKQARELHRSLWNLGSAPFLIVRLPHQIRIYNGFNYSQTSAEEGLLASDSRLTKLRDLLSDFTASAIDSGKIWQSKYAQSLNPNQRVNERLLGNLEQLGQALKKDGLLRETAHALIGKYVYMSYLRSRGILTNQWLMQQQIDPQHVFTLHATVAELRKLVEVLEERFNGHIFPIDFEQEQRLQDKHVSWVASIFSGNEIVESAPQEIHQLHLPFQAYDFRYIPVETLSAIYEQFIHERKKKGAIYTPEFLADYLLSEVESARPLEKGMKILDPACGSGVFLVLAYRRLIEKEMARLGRGLRSHELQAILLESIYGVEREQDACYVTEFSLILTLLHYVERRELERITFKFPVLHNQRIFECDFFDLQGAGATLSLPKGSQAKFWQEELQFDWIVGNPPWTKPVPELDRFVSAWMKDPLHKSGRPIGGRRIAEAFSWLVTDLLQPAGVVGLLLPATSLFNLNSKKYRQRFFSEHEVLRITNFANLRNVLFGKGKSDVLPAATIVYRQFVEKHEYPPIIHYAPYAVNQVSQATTQPWIITINENEIQSISPFEAEKGETALWKLALWGTYIDKRTLERIEYLFPTTLKEICEKRGWHFQEAAQLRQGKTAHGLEYIAFLRGQKQFQTNLMRRSLLRFSISEHVLEDIPDEMCYVRKRGGKAGLKVSQAPHLILSPSWMSYIIYSDQDFVIGPKHLGLAASKADANYLRALSVYLRSTLAAYWLFFHAHEWGVFRRARWVSITEVGKIPTPELMQEQIEELAALQRELVEIERREISKLVAELSSQRQKRLTLDESPPDEEIQAFTLPRDLHRSERNRVSNALSELQADLQKKIDSQIFRLFNIPEDIRFLVREWAQVRLPLDKVSTTESAVRRPRLSELLTYARELRDELDEFIAGTARHRVTINEASELIECVVEITPEDAPIPVTDASIQRSDLTASNLLAELSQGLREEVSQWMYVQRGLRLFDGPRIYLYKPPRLIDWTRTQAIKDSGELIGQILSTTWMDGA